MAAGDPIAMTNTLITALNADQTLTANAADANTNDLPQIFNYTPTGKDGKVAIIISVGDTHGAVAYSIAGGAGVFGTAAKTGSIAQNAMEVIQIETGRYMLATGKVAITLTPASGKKLQSEHLAKVYVIELQ
jgi:hypothetical protein